jgi:hypothetical protein
VRLAWLLYRVSPRLVWAAHVFVNGFLTIALLVLLAVLTKSPFAFHVLAQQHISYIYRAPSRKP